MIRRIFASALLALFTCDCRGTPKDAPSDSDARPYSRVEERVLDFNESNHTIESCEVELDGKTIGKGANHPFHVSIGEMREDDFVAAIPRMHVVVDSTCGAARLPVTKCNSGYCFTAKTAVFRIDNEGGPATTVTLGEKKIDVAAGELQTIESTIGTCAAARSVVIGGSVVGTLERDPPWRRDDFEQYLVDVTGKHCYESSDVVYGKGMELTPKPLPKARVYAMDAKYWFARPDDKAPVPEGMNAVTVKQVARCGKSQ